MFSFIYFFPVFCEPFFAYVRSSPAISFRTFFYKQHVQSTHHAPRASMPSNVYRKHGTAQSALHIAAKYVPRAGQSATPRKQADKVAEGQHVRIVSSNIIHRAMLQKKQNTCVARGGSWHLQIVSLHLKVWIVSQLHFTLCYIIPCERAQRAEPLGEAPCIDAACGSGAQAR